MFLAENVKLSIFSVGDEVTWTHTRKLKSGYSFSTRKGKITGIDGDMLWIQYKGQPIRILAREVRSANETSRLTEQVTGGIV